MPTTTTQVSRQRRRRRHLLQHQEQRHAMSTPSATMLTKMRTSNTPSLVLLSLLACYCCPLTVLAAATANQQPHKQLLVPQHVQARENETPTVQAHTLRHLQQDEDTDEIHSATTSTSNAAKEENPNFSCDERLDIYCPSRSNDICESNIGVQYADDDDSIPTEAISGCEQSDCLDCDYLCNQFALDCDACFNHGCYYCPGDGTCYNSPYYSFTSDAIASCSPSDTTDYIHFSNSASCSAYNKKQKYFYRYV